MKSFFLLLSMLFTVSAFAAESKITCTGETDGKAVTIAISLNDEDASANSLTGVIDGTSVASYVGEQVQAGFSEVTMDDGTTVTVLVAVGSMDDNRVAVVINADTDSPAEAYGGIDRLNPETMEVESIEVELSCVY